MPARSCQAELVQCVYTPVSDCNMKHCVLRRVLYPCILSLCLCAASRCMSWLLLILFILFYSGLVVLSAPPHIIPSQKSQPELTDTLSQAHPLHALHSSYYQEESTASKSSTKVSIHCCSRAPKGCLHGVHLVATLRSKKDYRSDGDGNVV